MNNKEQDLKPFEFSFGDFKNIYYDKDLETIRRLSKDLENVLKSMLIRFQHHDQMQIAKSVFDYVTQKETYSVFPNLYYDYRLGDCRICIGCSRRNNTRKYYVSVVGTTVNPRFNSYITDLGYGAFDALEEAITLFNDIIHDFTSTRLSSLF